jgi:hypothetical protein
LPSFCRHSAHIQTPGSPRFRFSLRSSKRYPRRVARIEQGAAFQLRHFDEVEHSSHARDGILLYTGTGRQRELNVAYVFVTQPLYFHQMSPFDAAKLFREKADVYLDMTAHVSDERHRRVLHELFEENDARADLLERMVHSDAISKPSG